MHVRLSRLDLKKTRANWPADMPFAPAFIYKRPVEHVERWHVVTDPVQFQAQQLTTTISYQDPYVRIPLFEYRLSPDADVALADMLQLGFAAAEHIPAPVKSLHIVAGFPVDLVYARDTLASLQYWFGFAYLLKD
jgi:hypothetical protein